MIPNREGQVLDDQDEQVHGVYATGWIKRGPVGLIGHTKSDAMETVAHVLNDQASWWAPEHPEESAVVALLEEREVAFTDLDGWHRLDEHEMALGEPEGACPCEGRTARGDDRDLARGAGGLTLAA